MEKNKSKIPLRNKNKEIIDYAIIDEKYYDEFIKIKWHKKDDLAFTYVDNKNVSMHSQVLKGKEK